MLSLAVLSLPLTNFNVHLHLIECDFYKYGTIDRVVYLIRCGFDINVIYWTDILFYFIGNFIMLSCLFPFIKKV